MHPVADVSSSRKEDDMSQEEHAVVAGCKRQLHEDPKKSLKCTVLVSLVIKMKTKTLTPCLEAARDG